MKRNMYEFPKSSFLAMPKDTALIMERILGCQNVLRLLYYNSPDVLENYEKYPPLNAEQIKSLFEKKQISNIPKLQVDKDKLSYLRIAFDSFTPNATNEFYRDHIVELRIICHFDDWDLHNYDLRPFRIAGEIDSLLNNTHLTGIGLLTFLSASQDVYDDEYGGVTLRYLAVRGNEDKLNPLS